jgi:SpoVK/Ycf46/Vps4 family AAA+-type ATPase
MTKVAIFHDKDAESFELGAEGDIVKQLPPGIYNAVPGPFGRRFIYPAEIETDKLVSLENSNTNKVMKDIGQFLSKETRDAFKAYELLYRRGILLYGPPGTGKTSTVVQICREFVAKHNGIVFLSFPFSGIGDWVRDMRSQDPDRAVLLVMEELDGQLPRHESEILSLLDGEDSVDNFIVLATTNYFDEIPSRIKNRPSRFSTVIEIGYPGIETRRAFLESRILPQHKTQVNIAELAQNTDGMSIDHLKDLIVSIFCFRLTPDAAIQKLKDMIAKGEDDEDD